MSFSDFFLGPYIILIPKIFFWAVFGAACALYVHQSKSQMVRGINRRFYILVVVSAAFRVLFALLLSMGQYYVWSQNEVAKMLVRAPFDAEVMPLIVSLFPELFFREGGYFLYYAFGRFWIGALMSVGTAFLFFLFLLLLKKYKSRLFDEGETALGFLCALVAGWPNIVIFLPLVMLGAVLVSLYRAVAHKEPFTTLGAPFLLALAATLFAGDFLVWFFGLSAIVI